MKRIATIFCLLSLTLSAYSQIEKASYESAVDMVNCKLIERVMSEGPVNAFREFKATCDCSLNPNYYQVVMSIPADQSRTKRLSEEIEQLKNEKVTGNNKDAVLAFLTNDAFTNKEKYPALYRFASKRSGNEKYEQLKQSLHGDLAKLVVEKKAPTVASTRSAGATSTSPAPVANDAEFRSLRDQVALLQASQAPSGGLMGQTAFQIIVLLALAGIGAYLFWQRRQSALIDEDREEIKVIVDRRLLTKMTNGGTTMQQPVERTAAEPLVVQESVSTKQAEKSSSIFFRKPMETQRQPQLVTIKPTDRELDLIFTKDDNMIVAKQHQDWKIWEEKIDHYKTSLSFQNVDELTDFLAVEYNLNAPDREHVGKAINESDSELLIMRVPGENETINVREFEEGSIRN